MENSLLIGDHITANTFIFKPVGDLEKKLFPFRDIKRGDVIVFKFPGDEKQDWIKRCVGIPGDRFRMVDDRIYIDNQPLMEEYTYYKKKKFSLNETDRDPDNRYYPLEYHTMKPGLEHGVFLERDNVNLATVKIETAKNLSRMRRAFPEDYQRIMDRLNSAPPDEIPEGFYMMVGDNRNRSYDSREWGLVPREFVQGRGYFVWWSYGEDERSHEKKGFDLIWSYLRVPITFWQRTHWPESFVRIK